MTETKCYKCIDGGYRVETGDQKTSFRTAENAAEMIGLLHDEIEQLRGDLELLLKNLQWSNVNTGMGYLLVGVKWSPRLYGPLEQLRNAAEKGGDDE